MPALAACATPTPIMDTDRTATSARVPKDCLIWCSSRRNRAGTPRGYARVRSRQRTRVTLRGRGSLEHGLEGRDLFREPRTEVLERACHDLARFLLALEL